MGKYEDAGMADGKAADDEIEMLNAKHESDTHIIDQQSAKIIELQHALEVCQGGHTAPTLYGASLQSSLGKYNDFANRCGGLEVSRNYLVPGKMPTALKDCGSQVVESMDKRAIVLSWKGADPEGDINKSCDAVINGSSDASFRGVMSSKSPTQKLSVIFRHEPDEEAFGDGAKFRGAQLHIRKLVDEVNKAGRAAHPDWVDVEFWANFMSWSLKINRNIEPLWTPDCWDGVSWDGYAQNAPLADFQTMFAKCVAWNVAHQSVRFGIGEYGAIKDDGRNAWLNNIRDGATASKAVFISYWNSGVYVLNATEEKTLGAQG